MRVSRATASALVALAIWPAVVSAHGTGSETAAAGAHEPAIPFVVAIGFSALLGVAVGLGTVSHYRSKSASAVANIHGTTTRREVTVLVIVLGLAALVSGLTQQWLLAIGGGLLGGAVAWVGREHGVSPHAGCADAALGAVLTHRVVEGILVAGIYATSASFGLVALTVLTVHALAETVAVGGLYAPVSRSWGIASVLAVQLGFLAGAVGGTILVATITPPVTSLLLAGVGGALLVTGTTEFRVAAMARQHRLEA
ncbi:hypothetical protein [Natrinema hispanicum]|uniref:Zinc transporter, ZIP family n=1 Tax=Natrinema hispanicum TaxID=392421 RepID=A0A1G6QM24_9EURY|nr:hypothetical protein [Natrinema hispanicum]SDC93368.1 hypothetical protein SAMN05192552_1009100 [Natrinema hispanicum]SET48385.1 hypothetical protein SAMN04488694_107101 [Natrinema hispanicum]